MRERIILHTSSIKSVKINAFISGILLNVEPVAGQNVNKSANQKWPSASLLMHDDVMWHKKAVFQD